MLQPRRRARFVEKPLHLFRRRRHTALENFERNEPVQSLLPGFENDANTAARHLLQNLVIPKLRHHIRRERRPRSGGTVDDRGRPGRVRDCRFISHCAAV